MNDQDGNCMKYTLKRDVKELKKIIAKYNQLRQRISYIGIIRSGNIIGKGESVAS